LGRLRLVAGLLVIVASRRLEVEHLLLLPLEGHRQVVLVWVQGLVVED
jgi:hypothetical protein